jgi:MFS transporter, YQGE family, putative transporter
MEGILKTLRDNKFRRGREGESFLRLFVSERLIQGAATAMLSIFLPIFLYEVTGGLFILVGLYYATLSLLYMIFLAPGMKLINHIGFSHSLILGGALCVVTNILLFLLTPENAHQFFVPIMFAMVGYWIFHWVPFHVDFTIFSTRENRNRQVSIFMATLAFMGIVGPILAGFIIANAGYQALFAVAVALLIAATISYVFVPEIESQFQWGIRHTWRQLFERKYRNILIGEYANGAEKVVSLIVWPIFLFEILNGDVLEIGAVSTVVVASTIFIQLLLGKYLDGHNLSLKKTLQYGNALYALGWIIKIFVFSTMQVFLVGLYHNIVKIFAKTPFATILYDVSAEQGRYVDEVTVLREMAQHFGRASGIIVIAFLSVFVPIAWTFVIAAVASIAMNLVYYTKD